MSEQDDTPKGEAAPHYYDMVVFCHLRWQFVYQRPQHIISRMAITRKVLFIEEPVPASSGNGQPASLQVISDNLHVLQPHCGSIQEAAELLPLYVSNRKVEIGWFYAASFLPLLKALDFETIVYDCMDELALFKDAPQALAGLEKELLSRADIVFTGGKSLYESKRALHGNVACFPSSVDQEHFAKAKNGTEAPPDIAAIPAPIVGYFGVIDERLDLELLAQVARLRPSVSFVMIGPLAKITAAALPRNTNIHYLGMKDYAALPGYLKAFSIAMMPFAMNDATRYISPTKTLEYMAAGKPIISTPVRDVVRDYGGVVRVVSDAVAFIQAVDSLLQESSPLRDAKAYDAILERTSWNATVSQMEQIIKSSQS